MKNSRVWQVCFVISSIFLLTIIYAKDVIAKHRLNDMNAINARLEVAIDKLETFQLQYNSELEAQLVTCVRLYQARQHSYDSVLAMQSSHHRNGKLVKPLHAGINESVILLDVILDDYCVTVLT